jgi:hypothetical protein
MVEHFPQPASAPQRGIRRPFTIGGKTPCLHCRRKLGFHKNNLSPNKKGVSEKACDPRANAGETW